MRSFFRGVKEGMASFGTNISTIVNTVLLFIVYIVGVGITSIIAKLSGKRFLETKLSKKSYWRKARFSNEKESHYRQF